MFDGATDAEPTRVIRLDPHTHRTYHYWHAFVPDLRPGQVYAYRAAGPFDPARGRRFDPAKVLYWLCYNLDGRPNYTLRQRMALAVGEVFAVADREFYVSRGYHTSQAIAGFIPVPEGTMVVYQSRVSTDQVAGFTSSVKKGIGRGVMAKQLTDIFERSRDSFQRRRSVPGSQ